jgi:pimeloyl-ACP methyl ester carboxylesterase
MSQSTWKIVDRRKFNTGSPCVGGLSFPPDGDPNVHLMGHSLGGAAAIIAGARLRNEGFNIANVYTMGAPNPGNFGYELFTPGTVFQVVNGLDSVARLPGAVGGFGGLTYQWENRPGTLILMCPDNVQRVVPYDYGLNANYRCDNLINQDDATFNTGVGAHHGAEQYAMSLARILRARNDALLPAWDTFVDINGWWTFKTGVSTTKLFNDFHQAPCLFHGDCKGETLLGQLFPNSSCQTQTGGSWVCK